MKKTLIVIAVLLFLLVSCTKRQSSLELGEESSAETQGTVQEESSAAEEVREIPAVGPNDTVVIGVRSDAAPDMYLDENGELQGFYVELEKLVMEEMGQAYELYPYDDVGVAIQLIKNGLMHNALAVPDLPDYRTFLDLSIPFERLNFVTFVPHGNTDIGGDSVEEIIESLHGKRVGVQTRGHIFQVLWEIKEIELFEYATSTLAMEDLAAGNLDAVPEVEWIGLYYAELNGWAVEPVGVPIISQPVTTGFSKEVDSTLVDRYNVALQAIIDDGRYKEVYERFHGSLDPEDLP